MKGRHAISGTSVDTEFGNTGAHSVQLSYSSPTLGLLGSYVREGVSNNFLTASTTTATPAMMASSLGSTGEEGMDEI